jgi:type I restriction-modification system DNA methylase subunit
MPKKSDASIKNAKGFEEVLWDTATKLRGSVESSEYKHVVLSLIFLKFVSDKFEERRAEMIEPYKGKIYDPCCGSGPAAAGFVQSLKFVESHHGNTRDISVYGQEMTSTTYKMAKMNESAKLDEIITENLAELGFSKG